LNALPTNGPYWHGGALDYTVNDVGGYMYVLDLGAYGSQLFNFTVNNLCIGVHYEFSAYLANVGKNIYNYAKPNIRFEVRTATVENHLLMQISTGDIPEYGKMTWRKYGVSFIASSSSIVLLMISHVEGSIGNDLAVDDIQLRVCSTTNSSYGPSR
jgi:hypothetical protein